MKYTFLQKLLSVLRNLARTHWKDVWDFFYPKIRKKINSRYNIDFEVKFPGDLTKEEDYDARDYQLSGADINALPKAQKRRIYMCDQWRLWRDRNSCVIMNTLLAIHNNLWISFSYDTFAQWRDWAEKERIWVETEWAVIPTVVGRFCKRWNETHPDRKVTYFRFPMNENLIAQALSQWYQVIWGRNVFPMYGKDVADRRIDFWDYSDKARRGWHCTNLIMPEFIKNLVESRPGGEEIEYNTGSVSDKLHIVNSYPTTQGRRSFYEHSRMAQHVKNRIWYKWGYLIVEADPKEVKKEKTDYEKYIERGFVEQPNPERVLTERLYGTLRERELQKKETE